MADPLSPEDSRGPHEGGLSDAPQTEVNQNLVPTAQSTEHEPMIPSSSSTSTFSIKIRGGLMDIVLTNAKQKNATTYLNAVLNSYLPATRCETLEALRSCNLHGGHPWAVDRKTDPNALPPLHVAVRNGDAEVLKLLLDWGLALTDERGETAPMPQTSDFQSPLLFLTRMADPKSKWHRDEATLVELAELLLQNGADVDFMQAKKKWTPLHTAAEFGASSLVQCLVKAGAQVDLQDALGLTALHWAAGCTISKQAVASTVQILLDANADPNLCNYKGATPLAYACKFSGSGSVISLLGGTPEMARNVVEAS
eukprot:3148263-Pleurochrysis_carterae.AAC.4